MKVVVGGQVYEPAPGQPIAVFLSEAEKLEVGELPRGVNLYAQFSGEGPRQERIDWAMRTRKACEPKSGGDEA